LQFGTTTFESDKVADYLAPKKEGDDDDEDVSDEDAPVRRAVDTHDIELVQDFYKYIRAEVRASRHVCAVGFGSSSRAHLLT